MARLFVSQKAAHHEDAGVADATAPQVHAFVDGTDGQPPGAFRDEHAGDLQRAMAVRIGLHHSGDFDIRAHHGADIAIVAGDLFARHEDKGAKGSVHDFILAESSIWLACKSSA